MPLEGVKPVAKPSRAFLDTPLDSIDPLYNRVNWGKALQQNMLPSWGLSAHTYGGSHCMYNLYQL